MTQATEPQPQNSVTCPYCGQALINPVFTLGQSLKFKTKDGYNLTGNIIDIYSGDIEEGYPPAARVFVAFTSGQFYYVDLLLLKEISEDQICSTTDTVQSITILVNNGNRLPMIPVSDEIGRIAQIVKDIEDQDSKPTNLKG